MKFIAFLVCASVVSLAAALAFAPRRTNGSEAANSNAPAPPPANRPAPSEPAPGLRGPEDRIAWSSATLESSRSPLRLHVLDSGGRELDSAFVVATTGDGIGHPGPLQSRRSVLAGKSPLSLPLEELEAGTPLWLGARGMAWVRLSLSESELGALEARRTMQASGELDVIVLDPHPDTELALSVLDPRGDLVAELRSLESGSFLFDGLAPGPYEVRLAPPGWSRAIPVVEASGVVEALVRTSVTIRCPPPATPGTRGTLAGCVWMPPEVLEEPKLLSSFQLAFFAHDGPANRAVFTTHLHPTDTAHASVLRADFQTPELAAGRFRIRLVPLGYDWEVVNGPGETGGLELWTEPLARTIVYPGNGIDDELVLSGNLTASVLMEGSEPRSSVLWPHVFTHRSASGDALEILSAPGKLRVFYQDERFDPFLTEVEVASGWNVLDLPLVPAISFTVSLADGVETLTAPANWWRSVGVSPVGTGSVVRRGLVRSAGAAPEAAKALKVSVSASGAYELQFPALPGHAVPSSWSVVVDGNDARDFRVPVTR